MLVARQAPVRPRVLTSAALPLEDEILASVAAGVRGVVYLLGPPGSGKTTALQHLAAVLPPDAPVVLRDEGTNPASDLAVANRLVLRAVSSLEPGPRDVVFRLRPWDRDELIEYLLHVHHDRCSAVLARVHANDCELLGGNPELWQIVLDLLARSPGIPDVRGALDAYLHAHLDAADRLQVGDLCLKLLLGNGPPPAPFEDTLTNRGLTLGAVRVLRHPEIQRLLAAECLAAELRTPAGSTCLNTRLPRELVEATAAELLGEPLPHLRCVANAASPAQAMAASILLRADPSWVPLLRAQPRLGGAYLETAPWSKIELDRADLRAADLSLADLREANLDHTDASTATLSHAQLSRASLTAFKAVAADLSYADLSHAAAKHSCWDSANLEGATLNRACLPDASFREANLTGASFVEADLARTNFTAAVLTETNFLGADLRAACLADLDLRTTVLRRAYLVDANLSRCNLEDMDLIATNWQQANLYGALLTGANLTRADFTGACLRETGLGEVTLEHACLRDADLRGATFHMGSSRSGLVFTPIASEGTRTGFYTDDADEQHFKAPEEIRKANLCGADLRGAQIEGVDFYLVDLRGALYDREQERHFRRCRAILASSTHERPWTG